MGFAITVNYNGIASFYTQQKYNPTFPQYGVYGPILHNMILPSYKYADTWWIGFEDVNAYRYLDTDWDYEDYVIRITDLFPTSQGIFFTCIFDRKYAQHLVLLVQVALISPWTLTPVLLACQILRPT